MTGAQEIGASVGGIGAGVGSTVLIRRQFDEPQETTVLRPSVLWGVGTGLVALAAPLVLGNRNSLTSGMVGEFVEDYGEAAIAAGAFSAFNPKGGNVQLPTV